MRRARIENSCLCTVTVNDDLTGMFRWYKMLSLAKRVVSAQHHRCYTSTCWRRTVRERFAFGNEYYRGSANMITVMFVLCLVPSCASFDVRSANKNVRWWKVIATIPITGVKLSAHMDSSTPWRAVAGINGKS
jgi:hypothetical protein